MKILVISSCSARQNKKPMPAAELYKGTEHERIKAGLGKVWEDRQNNDISVDWRLVSTGHGLIYKEHVLEPYDVSTEESQMLKSKELHKNIEVSIKDYDLVFFLLGNKFYIGQRLDKRPFEVSEGVTQIFLLGDSFKYLIPDLPNMHFVPAGKPLADKLDTNTRILKGIVFKKLCDVACRDGFEVFEDIKNNPQLILEIVQQNS